MMSSIRSIGAPKTLGTVRAAGFLKGEGLKARAVRGSAWTIGGFGTSQVLRLGSNLVLTRLLFPEAFGLMALVQVFMQGLNMFSDVGIRPSIIQNERGDDPDFLNTAWTIQAVRGVVLWLIACLGAYPFAHFYGEPMLMWLIPVAGLTAVIAGFNSTALATAGRHLTIGRLTSLEFVTQIISIIVMITCALIWRSVWALVIGGLAGSAFKMLLSHAWLATFRNRLHWDRATVRELVRFGKWIFVSTAVTFVASQADRLLLGRLMSMEFLGIYSIATMLALMPRKLVERLAASVLFPALAAHARQDHRRLQSKVLEARRVVLPPAMVMILAVILLGPTFFESLYDPRYHEAGWMAQLFSISTWLVVLAESARRVLVAMGRTGPQAAANAADAIVTIAACVIGFVLFQAPGLILGYAMGSVAKLVVVHIEMARSGLIVFQQDILYTNILLALVLFGGINWHGAITNGINNSNIFNSSVWLSLIAVTLCGLWALWTAGMTLFDPSRNSSVSQ